MCQVKTNFIICIGLIFMMDCFPAEAVALLVDADEDALKQAKFLVDASIAGKLNHIIIIVV